MTLLEDIQAAAVDERSDLGTLLRKCKVLAARLDNRPLEDWLVWESNGYPEGVSLPEYRTWPMQLKGHFAGPFGSGIRNAPIPLALLPKDAQREFERYECRESVASVEALVRRKASNGSLRVPTGDLALLLGTNVYQRQNCIQAWGEFGCGSLIELLNAVRNRILDFSLAIWKERPNAGELEIGQHQRLDPFRVTQIFNTTVLGGSNNVVGTASASVMTFAVSAGDFPSLQSVLEQNEVSKDDIAELHAALAADQPPPKPNSYGPKVSGWVSRMIKKAAEGSWSIGIATAGQLLPKLLAKYYGFQ